MGGVLVRKLIKQTKAISWPSDKGRVDQFLLSEAKSNIGAAGAGILGKTDAAVGQEVPGFDLPDGVFNQADEVLPLLVRDGCTQVLNFDDSFADKNDLRNVRDSGNPRVADQLRIERQETLRFFRVAAGRRLPFEQARLTVQLADSVDIGHEVVLAGDESRELDLQVAAGLGDANAVVLNEALEELNALPQHVIPAVVA